MIQSNTSSSSLTPQVFCDLGSREYPCCMAAPCFGCFCRDFDLLLRESPAIRVWSSMGFEWFLGVRVPVVRQSSLP